MGAFHGENDKYIPPGDRHTKWDDTIRMLSFITACFSTVEADQLADVAEFKVRETFRPITIDPRSQEPYEIAFVPLAVGSGSTGTTAWCSPEHDAIYQYIPLGGEKPLWPGNKQKPRWPILIPGWYKYKLTLKRDRLFGGDDIIDFTYLIREEDVEDFKMGEDVGVDGHAMKEVEENTLRVEDTTKKVVGPAGWGLTI